MSDFNEQLKSKAGAIKLRVAERRELRERIVAYMEYHPLPEHRKSALALPLTNAVTSEPFFMFRFNTRHFKSAAVLGMLLFVVGVPTLAERALPGDVLYPMKVLVNEEVRSSLAFSPYAKVEWEATRLERRLSEARLLAQEGKLTEDIERGVAQAVKQHSDAAQETILAMRATDTNEAALAEIALASVLEAQADIISLREEHAKLAATNAEVVSSTLLAIAVREAHANAVSAQRERPATPERLFAVIERDTTYAEELINSIDDSATEKEVQTIERRIADISRKVARAQELQASLLTIDTAREQVVPVGAASGTEASTATMMMVEDDSPSPDAISAEVIAILRAALTDTRKLISFMTDIEVRNSVDVEQLVPITLTDEERTVEVEAAISRIHELRSEVEARNVGGNVGAKVELGLGLLDEAVERATLALAARSFDEADAASAEAEALAVDLRALVEDSELKPVAEVSTSTPTTTTPTSTDPDVAGAGTSTSNSSTAPTI